MVIVDRYRKQILQQWLEADLDRSAILFINLILKITEYRKNGYFARRRVYV